MPGRPDPEEDKHSGGASRRENRCHACNRGGTAVHCLPPNGGSDRWQAVPGRWRKELAARATRRSWPSCAAFATPTVWATSPRTGWPTRGPTPGDSYVDYLSLPLNAYRHEALVGRLFKGAEEKGDDERMGLFLVAFDRSIRRNRKTITRRKWDRVPSREAAEARLREWEEDGYWPGRSIRFGRQLLRLRQQAGRGRRSAHDAMPRPKRSYQKRNPRTGEMLRKSTPPVSDAFRQRLEKRFVLFRPPTRRYLRRRAWRYFRKVGKADAERYRAAASRIEKRYADADVDSDVHLLDNWGLVHTLFFGSPALVRPAKGWEFAKEKPSPITQAPRFPAAWTAAPERCWNC